MKRDASDPNGSHVEERARGAEGYPHARFRHCGVMMCALVLPASMIHAPPCLGLSGSPIDAVVAPGTATVVCVRALA
jgi:hypothetical protein